MLVYYVPWTAPNFDADSHQSYHGWGLVKKHPMQNFRPLEQQEPLSGWPWSFHRNLWQRQNLHNRNIDSNANSIQTSTSPWRRFLLSQRPKILHGMFFYQASTVVRLVRAIVKVWGASRDVMCIHASMRKPLIVCPSFDHTTMVHLPVGKFDSGMTAYCRTLD